jgi:hypothetical protein
MTLGAAHRLVSATQRKVCSRLVVKQGGLPLHAVVTLHASRYIGLSELPSVDVLVTVLALPRRGPEINIAELGFKIGWLMAIDASCGAMGAQECELRLGMVEPREFLP